MTTTRTIPFYSNREDDESCMLACYRSVLEYFDGRPYSWEELEKLSGFKPGRAAWTVKAWTTLARQGFDIKMTENFDYHEYFKEGEAYLQTFLKPEELKYQLERTNLLEIRPLLPEFFKTVRQIQKSPVLADIDELLSDGYLVLAQLNSRALNQQAGYVAHMVLITTKEHDMYIAHDPGLPGQENRSIAPNLLYNAMGGENNTTEVTGIKKGKNNGES
jgi:hypothetical protein